MGESGSTIHCHYSRSGCLKVNRRSHYAGKGFLYSDLGR